MNNNNSSLIPHPSSFDDHWFRRAGPTLDMVGDAPRGLYDRLRYVADILRDAGPLPAKPHILYRKTDGKVRALPLAQEVSIGRELPSNHVINDAKLSRRHFCVCPRGTRIVLYDLSSRNGTYVNGGRIKERELRDGDIIEAGGQVFVLLQAG